MKLIEFTAGTPIERAADKLVAEAPAHGLFNGIDLCAHVYALASDIVAEYHRRADEMAEAWRRTPPGVRQTQADEERRRVAQRDVDLLVTTLPTVDMTDPKAVLAWVEAMVEPADHVGARYDRSAVKAYFRTRGWDHLALRIRVARTVRRVT